MSAVCDYQGYEFGAGYLDSVCIDGMLWDADSGYPDPNGDGWCYTSGGDDPCPLCRFKAAVSRLAEVMWSESGRARNRKWFINEARRRIRAYLTRRGYNREMQTP